MREGLESTCHLRKYYAHPESQHMKNKKMSLDEVRFLHNKGMINDTLEKGWEHKNEKTTVDKSFQSYEQDVMNYMFIAFLSSACGVFANCFIPGSYQFLGIGFAINIGMIFLAYGVNSDHPFTKEINELQEMYTEYGSNEIRGVSYVLNRDIKLLIKYSEDILTKLGDRLTKDEADLGPESPATCTSRMLFKECHRINCNFELCDEDQGKWLRQKVEPCTSHLIIHNK